MPIIGVVVEGVTIGRAAIEGVTALELNRVVAGISGAALPLSVAVVGA